jgi:signal transduction histidine kinase
MTAKRSLRQVLARQWMAFALVLFAGFATMAVLLLFILEDSFIDQRLREVAAGVQGLEHVRLPDGFELHARTAAPTELRARMQDVRPGGIREFRRRDGRYVHVLAGRTTTGDGFLLAYDVSRQMQVSHALARAWPWLAVGMGLIAGCAYLLASRFLDAVSDRARSLLRSMATDMPPEQLRQLAEDEPIHEFSALARFAAQAWESRLAALERERETLAFLGHELRTPLQSARNSLALLENDRGNEAAWARLQRAQQRLSRASHSVLWLVSTAGTEPLPRSPVAPIAEALMVEFAPLAAQREQQLQLQAGAAAWPMPVEVIETVLANLLLNAIQHGGPGPVRLMIDDNGAQIDNALASEPAPPGFGLGLVLVERLLQRFGWKLTSEPLPDQMRSRLRPETHSPG